MKVALTTLGCKVNQYESAMILEALGERGFSLVPFTAKADCYIINTCTVTGKTDYQSRQLIRRANRRNPDAAIIVTGCYAQIAPYDIVRIPGVTLVAGNREKEIIPDIIREIVNLPIRRCPSAYRHNLHTPPSLYGKGIQDDGGVFVIPDSKQVLVSDISQIGTISRVTVAKLPEHTRAFLKIQDGCNSFCSYCIVPFARGPSRSLPEKEVLDCIAELEKSNYREIVLTGIHLGNYGHDLTPPSSLLKILKTVEEDKRIDRLRLSSIEATEITDDIISFMAGAKILCRHLHIPLQSGDDRILSLMRRNYNVTFFKNLLGKICQAIPDIAIGIDVMVGFPGEDEEAFQNTRQLIEEVPLAYLHVFPYSERPKTHGASLPGKVKETDKKRRAEVLRNLGKIKRKAFAERFVGKTMPVLIEQGKGKNKEWLFGHSDNYIPIVIGSGNSSYANEIVRIIPEYYADGKLYTRTIIHD